MAKRILQQLIPILIILVPLLALYQVSAFCYTLKWDFINYSFPSRYFMADSFAHGYLPHWCPYANLGYPFFADPQSGLWYPLSFILALVTDYNIYVMQAELLLHIVIAAYGMYNLCKTIGSDTTACVVAAIAFPLSGFFIAHATHTTFIISMAWMPFVFNYLILGMREGRYVRFLQLALVLALCLTGGYIALVIICVYGLLAMFLYFWYKQNFNYEFLKRSILHAAVSMAAFLLLTSGYLISFYSSLPYIDRAEGISLEMAQTNAFTPACLLSFFFPFATAAQTSFFDTDITMRNAYLGILVLPLVFTALIRGKKKNWLIFLLALVCLGAAMGDVLPIRKLLYYDLPLMKTFRHTSIFRAFSTLCLLVLAVLGLQILCKEDPKAKTTTGIFLILELVFVAVVSSIAFKRGAQAFVIPDFLSVEGMMDFNSERNVFAHILVQSIFQIALLLVLIVCVFVLKTRKLAIALGALWALDVAVAAQLNVPATVVSNTPVSRLYAGVKNLGTEPPNVLKRPVNTFGQYGGGELEPINYNAGLLRKEPSPWGFTGFYLKQYIDFLDSPLSNYTIKQPLAFLSNEIRPMDALERDIATGKIQNSTIYAELGSDSFKEGSLTIPEILFFKPNTVSILAKTERAGYLTFLQSSYPGWKATVNGQEAEIIKTNRTFMTVALAPGVHDIVFRFHAPHLAVLLFLQWLAYAVVLGLIIWITIRQRRFALKSA